MQGHISCLTMEFPGPIGALLRLFGISGIVIIAGRAKKAHGWRDKCGHEAWIEDTQYIEDRQMNKLGKLHSPAVLLHRCLHHVLACWNKGLLAITNCRGLYTWPLAFSYAFIKYGKESNPQVKGQLFSR